MKRFFFILVTSLLLGECRKLTSNWVNDKEHIPPDLDLNKIVSRQTCRSNADCGETGCCFSLASQCYTKPNHTEPCVERSSCPCLPGLTCAKYKEFEGQKFHRCMYPEEFTSE